jgi:hypothetical protein
MVSNLGVISDSWLIVAGLPCHCPSRSEYLARINNESRLKHEIQQLTQALELEKQNTVTLVAQAKQQAKPKVTAVSETLEQDAQVDHTLALNIQFYDPKQLLNSVNQSVSVPYFKLCQIFLNKSIELCAKHYQLSPSVSMSSMSLMPMVQI